MASVSRTTMKRLPSLIHLHAPLSWYIQRVKYCEKLAQVSEVTKKPELSDEEIENIRNCSGLRKHDHFLMNKGLPRDITEHEMAPHMKTLQWQRREIGRYGFRTKYDPGICFATKEEMEDCMLYEKVAFDKPLLQIWKEELEKIAVAKKEARERDEQIARNLESMPDWKKKIRDKMNAKIAVAEKGKEERARMLEEVRRFFGYTIDLKDERFQIMLEHKEKEMLKQKKLEKKKKKEEEFLAKLASLESGAASPKKKCDDNKTEDSETTSEEKVQK